ncbi:MAG: PHP domain-containing protein [Asgard group archaeon]|nr:PHP domain-containing protein [Asgard group archaeon]
MEKSILKSILIRFSILMSVSLVLIVSSVLIAYYPPSRFNYTNESFNFSLSPIYNETQFNIVFDHHSHTKYSDGVLTVEQNILWHIAHGFNAMSLSDHNTMKGIEEYETLAPKYSSQIVLLNAMEWTTSRIHLNLIGITELVPVPFGSPSDAEIQAAIDATHDQGGVVVVDHIPWSLPRMPDHPTRAQLLDWGVDYIEMVNEWMYDTDSESWCNDTGGFGEITGTDMHHPMNVWGWTLMNAQNFTTEGVMEQLLAKNTTIIYDSTGQVDQSTAAPSARYKIMKPFVSLGNHFIPTNGFVDWQSLGIAISYIVVGFIIVEASVIGIRKLRKRRSKK